MHSKDPIFLASLRGAYHRSTRVIQRLRNLGSSRTGTIAALLAIQTSVVFVLAYFSPDKVKVLLNVKTKEELINSVFRNESFSDYRDVVIDIKESFSPDKRLDVWSISLDMEAISRLSCKLSNKVQNDCEKRWAKGSLKVRSEGKTYSVKLRSKGDRKIHYNSFKTMSFLIKTKDINEDKSLPYGMNRFSLMRPVTRGYEYELFAASIYRLFDIEAARYGLVKVYINGEYVGLRMIEQSPNVFFLEERGLRAGRIIDAPSNSWERLNAELRNALVSNNAAEVSDFDTIQSVSKFIDPIKWGAFLAVSDVLSTLHTVQPKNVKSYLNPTTKLIEPIFFDGHQNYIFDRFYLFQLKDRFDDKDACNADLEMIKFGHAISVCEYYEWINTFFGSTSNPNVPLIKRYYDTLWMLSDESFIRGSLIPRWHILSGIRGHLYRSLARGENFFEETPLPYISRRSSLLSRLELAKKYSTKAKQFPVVKKLTDSEASIELLNKDSVLPQLVNVNCGLDGPSRYLLLPKGKKVILSLRNSLKCKNVLSATISVYGNNQDYPVGSSSPITVRKTNSDPRPVDNDQTITFKSKNDYRLGKEFINKRKVVFEPGTKICFLPGGKLQINSSEVFIGTKTSGLPVTFQLCEPGLHDHNVGSIDITNSTVNINSVLFKDLGDKKRSATEAIHGGINIIGSSGYFGSIIVDKSRSEDGINFVDSIFEGGQLIVNDAFSDSIDSDSSTISIESVSCMRSGNDCLDLSNSNARIGNILTISSADKALSAGERSIVFVNKMISTNDEISVTVKDSSSAYIRELEINDARLPIAIYNKKAGYHSSGLIVETLRNAQDIIRKMYVSVDSYLRLNGKALSGKFSSSQIMSKLYGNQFGKKSVR